MSAAAAAPAKCPECAEHKQAADRLKNRLITAGQSVIGTGQAAMTGTGIWLFIDGQPLQASAAAVLAGLGYPAIKMLARLRPKG